MNEEENNENLNKEDIKIFVILGIITIISMICFHILAHTPCC